VPAGEEERVVVPKRGEVFEYEGEHFTVPDKWPQKREGSRGATHPHLLAIMDDVLGPEPHITHEPDRGPACTRYLCKLGRKGLASMGKRIMLEIMAKVRARHWLHLLTCTHHMHPPTCTTLAHV
jgi:hypothetical protein